MILCRDLPSPLETPVFIGVSAREVSKLDLPYISRRPPVTSPMVSPLGSDNHHTYCKLCAIARGLLQSSSASYCLRLGRSDGRSMGGLREVSKQDLPCRNLDKHRHFQRWREVWWFFCLHLIYQDTVGLDHFVSYNRFCQQNSQQCISARSFSIYLIYKQLQKLRFWTKENGTLQ